MLVAIEGIDACGKATQAAALAAWLTARGVEAEVISFPRYETETGKVIRGLLRGGSVFANIYESADMRAQAVVLQSLMAANRYEVSTQLAVAADDAKKVTILDRYWASGYAYGVADGLDRAWLMEVHRLLPKPRAWLFLDVGVEVSMLRRPERRDQYEASCDRLTGARLAYLDLFGAASEATGWRHRHGSVWHVVDGARDAVAVTERLVEILAEQLTIVAWAREGRGRSR